MLVDFFLHLKSRQLPVSTKELLALLEALEARLVTGSLDDFYLLARTLLVKDEALYDRFDRAFGEYFKGIEALPGFDAMVPEEWLELAARTPPIGSRPRPPAEAGLREAPGAVEGTAGRAEGAPCRRQQVDRHRRHLALRPWRLQPGGGAHRRRIGRQPHGDQGVGPARIPQSRRLARPRRRATSRSPSAACAASPARVRRPNSI